MIHATRKILLGWSNQENYIGEAFSMDWSNMRKACNIVGGKDERKRLLSDQGVDKGVILKWIFKEVICKGVDKNYSA